MRPGGRKGLIVEPDDRSPLDQAIAHLDRGVMGMVDRALRRKEAMLAFQPIMGLGSGGRPVFYEGLIRLLDDGGRIIPARDFMGAVEETEAGRLIDCLSLEMGLDALAREPALRLAINMSARSIAYPQWMRVLRRGLRACPGASDRLILEITEESAMALPDIVTIFMKEMQAEGICFALDDFGAGTTNFRTLSRFLFDFVKIDGQFIRGIAENPDSQCMVRALVAFAREFDMATVAESVESAADADVLANVGIDFMQGYYFGAPTVTPPWHRPVAARQA